MERDQYRWMESDSQACRYTWRKSGSQASCCYRPVWEDPPDSVSEDPDRCIWHTEIDDATDKPYEKLEGVREHHDNRWLNQAKGENIYAELIDCSQLPEVELNHIRFNYCRLKGADLSGATIRNCYFNHADLHKSDLSGANLVDNDEKSFFTEANLRDATLTEINLSNGNLIGVKLERSDLTEATLNDAILRDARLKDASLTGADLRETNFTDADLRHADLSRTNLPNADDGLSEGDSPDTDFTDADLRHADLSKADLRNTDFTDADLRNTDFTDADLRNADLSGSDPRNADFTDADLRGTNFSKLGKNNINSSNNWNELARTCHNLANECSHRGLTKQSRNLTILERHARRKEARNDWNQFPWNLLLWARLTVAWQATGYGISILRVTRNMVILFLVATLGYLQFGIRENDIGFSTSELFSCMIFSDSCPVPHDNFVSIMFDRVYYSVVTFTTAPPGNIPDGIEVQSLAMLEAFLGTLLVVLFAYVLGNRESF